MNQGSRRSWRWLLAPLLLLLIALLLRPALHDQAIERLSAHGCSAKELRLGLGMLHLDELTCPGLRAASATLDLRRPWKPRFGINKAELDLREFLQKKTTSTIPSGASASTVVEIHQLKVRFGSQILAENLEGSLNPVRLRGPGVALDQENEGIRLTVERTIQGEHLDTDLNVSILFDRGAGRFKGRLTSDRVIVKHPLLARRALRWSSLGSTFEGAWKGGFIARGELEIEGCALSWRARTEDDEGWSFEAFLPETPATRALLPLESIVPEASRARVLGTVAGRVAWSQKGGLEIEPVIAIQGVTGALPPGLQLDSGPFSYLVRSDDGERVLRTSGEGTAGWTPFDNVSRWVVHALLASEDIAFYRHKGIDEQAIRLALQENLQAGEVKRGGSTLTQQLVKNLFLDGEQTLARKIREALLAVELDQMLGKKRILELYLNIVEWGPGIFGIGQACDLYLLKDPMQPNPLESAFLVALLPNPRRYYKTWFLAGRSAKSRTDTILDNMTQAGWIMGHTRDHWKATRLTLAPPPAGSARSAVGIEDP